MLGAPDDRKTAMATKLLLADDEEGIRKVLGIYLADSGFEVLTAEDGLQALEVFRKEHPAIVLTDLRMPGLDGIELLRTIKSERPDTEVVMITGHGDMDLAIESLKLEATDFVTKPINDDVLDIALKRAQERIAMRRQLREYTENLESLVRQQASRLVEAERLAAIGQALEGISSAFRDMAGEVEGGVRFFNEMPCFVAIHDRDLKVLAVNPLYRQRLGDRVGGRSWEIYADRNDPAFTCPVGRTFASGQVQHCREAIVHGDGSRWPVMVHTVPIRNSQGDLELALEFAMDASEVERLRQELQATQDRLSSLGLMLSSVSHGVKGILTGLDAGVYLAESGLRKGLPDQAREGLETVKEMVERVRRLVLDVLYFAKERPLEVRRVPVTDFAESLLALAASRIRRHAIELAAEIAPDSGDFEVDEGIAAAALLNLLDNAVDACVDDRGKPVHRIAFRARGEGDHVIFEIEDDGIGMSADAREKLFKLFFSSKSKAGTGLGLFIAQQVVRQHGGSIDVRSEPGQGACFRVRWPRVPGKAEEVPSTDGRSGALPSP
jgi:signal transduction histidine kinase/FixJ family two-component response regulator